MWLASPSAGAQQAVGDQPAMSDTLTNGLHVLVLEDASATDIVVALSVRVSPADDPRGGEGSARLVEELLTEAIEPGSVAGAATQVMRGSEVTSFVDVVGDGELELTMWLAAWRLAALRVDEQRFALLRDRLLRRATYRLDHQIGAAARERLEAVALAGHPRLGRDPRANLANLSRAEVIAFHAAHYAPAQAVLTVAGPVAASDVVAKARRYFQAIAKGRAEPSSPAPPSTSLRPQTSPRSATLRSPASHRAGLAYGWAIDTSTPRRLAAVDVAVEIAAERIVQQLIHGEAKALSLQPIATRRFGPSVAGMLLELPRAHLPSEAIGAVEREIRRVAGQQPPADELSAAKRRCHRRRLAAIATAPERAHAVAERVLFGASPDELERELDLVLDLSATEVQSAARDLLLPSRATAVEAFAAALPYGSVSPDEGGEPSKRPAPRKRTGRRTPKQGQKATPKKPAKKPANKPANKPAKKPANKKSAPKPKSGKGRQR